MKKVYVQKFNTRESAWVADAEIEIYDDGERYFNGQNFFESIEDALQKAFDNEMFFENGNETREESDKLAKEFFKKNNYEYRENAPMCEISHTNGNTEIFYGDEASNESIYEYMAGYDTQSLNIYTIEQALELAKDKTEILIRRALVEEGLLEDEKVTEKNMIKNIIDNFKPASYDTELLDFQLEEDMRYKHLQELEKLLRADDYEDEADSLAEFLQQDEINERLLQKLCEKTDAHPVHK